MKHMRKAAVLLLALTLLFAMSVPAAAAGEGTITINGVSDEATYKIYKLLDLSLGQATGAYSYTVNSAWTGFFATTEAQQYVSIDDAGYVSWKESEADSVVAEFAKLALAYAKANSIAPVQSSENSGEFVITEGKGVFSNLDLGYYLVDSTMGALCGLTTTNPNASINAKNDKPVVEKQVKEDSTENWGTHNSADIGQTVEFRTTISVHAGAESYILHDDLSDGLTFQSVSKIEHVIPGKETHDVPAGKYTVRTKTTDPAVSDDCDFEVVFTQTFCNEMSDNDKIIVYYSDMLNRNAVIAGTGNTNNTYLSYGENHTTQPVYTQTYTYQIEIVKTDSANEMLSGAQFRIYDAETGGNEVAVVQLMEADETTPVLDSNGNPIYRRAKSSETGVAIVVPANGLVQVIGMDNGTYYLEETVAPDGYNKLTARQKFIISDKNLDAVFNDGAFSTGSGVHVINKTGNMLPQTGGMGTVLFVAFGMLVVMGTGVLLVTKRRMRLIED